MLKDIAKAILKRPSMMQLRRTVFYGAADVMDSLLGRRDPLVPPRRMIFIGGQDFKEVGDEFIRLFRDPGGLQPGHSVLDVGCGIGRMARPLTGYLDPAAGGRYEGFDIDKSGVAWCRAHVTPRFPHFRFQTVDIFNKYYNPGGRIPASGFTFPYPDGSFDFAFLTSVFTHMFPQDVERYLSEIARVLKPGGKVLGTYFLWNAESSALVESGRSRLKFPYAGSGFRHADRLVPEDAIALPEAWVLEKLNMFGLEVEPPVHYGRWCGRTPALSYQDIVVARKRPG